MDRRTSPIIMRTDMHAGLSTNAQKIHTWSSTISFQTFVMPGQQISKVDRRKIDSKFLCSKCELLLNEPMQTQCGHLLCKSCLQVILRYIILPSLNLLVADCCLACICLHGRSRSLIIDDFRMFSVCWPPCIPKYVLCFMKPDERPSLNAHGRMILHFATVLKFSTRWIREQPLTIYTIPVGSRVIDPRQHCHFERKVKLGYSCLWRNAKLELVIEVHSYIKLALYQTPHVCQV
jgi:hypothetical protein